MKKRQSDKKTSKQVRMDSELHKLIKVKAAKSGKTIKKLVGEYLLEVLNFIPND